jgi:predicted nucleic acid-binding protein
LLTASHVELIPITVPILRTAAKLRAEQNLKTPDAIHAATAALSNCDFLISNDEGFRRLTSVSVIILNDLI